MKDYDEMDESEFDYDTFDNWCVEINKTETFFDTKEDCLEYIVEYINSSTDYKFENDIKRIVFTDYTIVDIDELIDYMYDLNSTYFYDSLKMIDKYYDIKFKIYMINLNGEEPEFGR